MITPTDIRQKALKLWDSGKLLTATLQDETLFPWPISFRKPNARQQLEDFASIRTWMETLKNHSRETRGHGYGIEYKAISHRQLGEQRLPHRILFASREELLRFIGKQTEFEQLHSTAAASINRYPALQDWIISKPRQFMKYASEWSSLLTVVDYFIQHPRPDCYLRELDIQGIDSKFIEQHKGILSELLDTLLPAESINAGITGSKQYGFERRYGLKYPEPLLRLRLLDNRMHPEPGISDLSLPLSQWAAWDIPCQHIFITENKINGLSFPELPESIVIFGLGYGVDSLAQLAWAHDRKLFYWGDIDTHGFSILSRLRSHFPRAQSLMMDRGTLEKHVDLCVTEPKNARCTDTLNHLRPHEEQLYRHLQQSHQRLEQERLPMNYVQACIHKLVAA